eukprot:gnl/TRDRNA2_/TRDRNA2_171855_c0_seq3.p1 gnl/TRDRNA2_/TRDRNA2_171855_c0~~gnl/TRDRNA2_/TRDRNA2_171855_c0_seq3.p1  ORF type:complete len:117 (+),score=11.78 gnl/TRDRNA2_/TRDRNA2_171855_c0_seq3:95-445(+)
MRGSGIWMPGAICTSGAHAGAADSALLASGCAGDADAEHVLSATRSGATSCAGSAVAMNCPSPHKVRGEHSQNLANPSLQQQERGVAVRILTSQMLTRFPTGHVTSRKATGHGPLS